MEHNKHAFADSIAKSYHAQPRIASPCQPIRDMRASKPSYASATRGQPCPVLIANYADGAKPAGPRLFSQCRPVAGSRLGRASPTAGETEG
ncbi:hypothetical protein DAPPUDRAFT_249472 [Daphnia pulex]|uniref:Uncharacterized protein n=1 Tax=Daphnia pulex TaxID=6669 RepID=E9GWQ9_DAPPU|nr:hypothetical protein DAPPUDRAFT_249472 [Daphnia pulex]|eukprot:EFX76071.1 hypothetical protein DAPPUDRAFT_249472 [Daphnia pulex]